MPFCELSVEVSGFRSDWVLFGTTPQIFDAGGVLEAILHSDLEQLAATSTGRSRWLPWFHRAAKRAVAPFMESELNQEIIEASTQGMTSKAIVERVNRSVSEAYVRESLLNLRNTIQAVSNWSRLKWLLALNCLAIPFAVATLAYLDRGARLELYAPATRLFVNVPSTSGFLWGMGLLTVPFTLIGWFFAKWASARWLKNAGGKRSVTWAERNGLLMGKLSAVTIIATALTSSSAFFNRWPIWIDGTGKAYGLFALFQPPRIIEPAAPVTKVREKRRTPKKKVAPKRSTAINEPQLQPSIVESAPQREWPPATDGVDVILK